MYRDKLGIIGGFGAYATLDFYARILEEFRGESEREYPHIIIDNNFTMPSRTRALLYNDEYDEVVEMISASIKRMIEIGVEKIVLVCGTAHYFLPDVYKKVPEASKYIVDIIELLGRKLSEANISEVFVIAAEGALKRDLYTERLDKYKVECDCPEENEWKSLRYFIEAVKKNRIDEEVQNRFLSFLYTHKKDKKKIHVVLGCTEFPVIIHQILNNKGKDILDEFYFWNPLEIVIAELKNMLI